jgi:hypothetical protein
MVNTIESWAVTSARPFIPSAATTDSKGRPIAQDAFGVWHDSKGRRYASASDAWRGVNPIPSKRAAR